jgi:hypothetical protein
MAKIVAENFTVVDTYMVFYMPDQLGINMPFIRKYEGRPAQDAPDFVPPPKPQTGAPAPPAESNPGPLGNWPGLQKEELPTPQKRQLGPVLLRDPPAESDGDDALGGRMWEAPEEVHEEMLAKLNAREIPPTTVAQRRSYMRSRPTFYGPQDFKQAVKFGYLHPRLAAPKGMKWKELTAGWKLILVDAQPAQPSAATIEEVLRTGQPNWSEEEVSAERAKLAKIRIDSVADLANWLKKRGAESLNGRLAIAGQEHLRPEAIRVFSQLAQDLE